MKTQTAYCSARDAQVAIAWTEDPSHEGQAPLHDAEVVCLDYGDRCTGELCPAFGLPRILMGVRLARSDFDHGAMRTVNAPCPACGEVVDLRILDAAHVFCPACENTQHFVRVEVGDEDYLALTGV